MSKIRANRIAEEIKRELSQIIREELKDPRITGIISITSVEVTGDLRYAKVYISQFGANIEESDIIKVLEKASGFIRSELGKRIRLRYVPELIFKFDESMEHGAKITAILAKINKRDDNDESTSED